MMNRGVEPSAGVVVGHLAGVAYRCVVGDSGDDPTGLLGVIRYRRVKKLSRTPRCFDQETCDIHSLAISAG